jgi:hypothetical protein
MLPYLVVFLGQRGGTAGNGRKGAAGCFCDEKVAQYAQNEAFEFESGRIDHPAQQKNDHITLRQCRSGACPDTALAACWNPVSKRFEAGNEFDLRVAC